MKYPAEASRIIYHDANGTVYHQCGACNSRLYTIWKTCPFCDAELLDEVYFKEGKDYYYYVDDEAHVDKILAAIEKNGGYCPCRLDKTEDTICPCKEYRTTGHCHCGLFTSFEVSE